MSLSPSYTRKKGLQPTDNEKKKTNMCTPLVEMTSVPQSLLDINM